MMEVKTARKVDKAIEDGWKRQIQRIIAHVDLDAFYSQVEVKNDPERLTGKPVGVMQYNPYGDLASHAPHEDRIFNDSNGSLIAVSYEARAFGVKRNMRGDEARRLCPELMQVQVPTAHGKADLTHYRAAGKQVTDILARLSVCEKASIDECYLDVTKEAHKRLQACQGCPPLPVHPSQIHVCGQEGMPGEEWWERDAEEWTDEEMLLACGASVVADLRAAVKTELGFTCSAGVANCKILAKLASGMHKPSQQTVVPAGAVEGLLEDLPIPKLRQLGGKMGDEVMRVLNIKTVGQLAAVPKSRLTQFFPDSQACWLHELAHGIDADEVKQRTLPKSIGCGKTFHGKHTLYKLEEVSKWVGELAQELEERVTLDQEENSREPKLVTIHASSNAVSWHGGAISRSGPLRRPTAEIIAEDALNLLKKWTSMTPGWSITGLSLVVSNFVAAPRGNSTLARFFKTSTAKATEKSPLGNKAALSALNPDAAIQSKPRVTNTQLNQRCGTLETELRKPCSPASEAQCSKDDSSRTSKEVLLAAFPWAREADNTNNSRKTEHQCLEHHVGSFNDNRAAKEEELKQVEASDPPDAQKDRKGIQTQFREDQDQLADRDSHSLEPPDRADLAEDSSSCWRQPVRSDQATHAGSIDGVDREVWESLPKEIQRELRLHSMAALGQKQKQKDVQISRPQKKAKTSKPIANFFHKKS